MSAARSAFPRPAVDLIAVDALSEEAHTGQTRRHGAAYVEHPRAVRRIVEDLAHACRIEIDDVTRAVALLHDVIEDSDHDETSLRQRFGPDVAREVALLSKSGKGEDATARYYERLLAEGDARLRLVKIADRCHNLSELHKAPSREKLLSYVDETRRFVLPLAHGAPGLTRALEEALRTALRAQRAPVPRDLATSGKVPRGLYAIVGAAPNFDALALRVRTLCQSGVAMVQLRLKGAEDRELLETLALVLHECDAFDVPVLVNDRADLCAATGADGVHVGQTDLPASMVRRVVGRDAMVGTSSHTRAQAQAADDDASNDYVALGPIFASPTKQGHADIVSTRGLLEVASECKRPVVAIGGITDPARVVEVVGAGAHLAAVVSALDSHDPHLMARRMSLAFAATEPFSAKIRS